MSKYCIYQDRPLCGLVSGEQDLSGGCVIFGVQHHCKGCPNCIEMGDEPYSMSATANPPTFGLTISLRKKKMKAKFNRQAYAESIQAHSMVEEQPESPKNIYSFKKTDYSFHIQDTSGRVLSCSEAWFK